MEEITSLQERVVYLNWKSHSRLYKKRDKDFFRNIAAIVFLLLVILFFAREFPLILAVVSVAFVVYVFSTVPPEEIEHSLTSKGIESAGKTYEWDVFESFWFEEQWGQKMLVVAPKMGPRLILLLGDVTEGKVKSVVNRFLRFEETPQKNIMDNAATWLSEKIPLEKPAS